MSATLSAKHEAVMRKAAAVVRARGHEGDARLADSLLGVLASLQQPAKSGAGEAGSDTARRKLAHGHRDDYYLMANARRVASYPIHQVIRMTNAHFASELFATGSNSGHQICVDAGIDPDATKVERVRAAPTEQGDA